MRNEKITIALDFDGVLHSFSSGWTKATDIPDPPTEGAISWLHIMLMQVRIVIYSARVYHWGGKAAMKKWLLKWGLTPKELKRIKFAYRKPICQFLLDDRVVQFRGSFPTLREIVEFKPWHGKEIW